MFNKAGMVVTVNQTFSSAELVSKVFVSASDVAVGKLNPFQFNTLNLYENKGSDFILPFLPSNVFTEPGNTKGAESGGLLTLVGMGLNTTRHKDTARDALIWAAAGATDPATRSTAWKAVTKYLQENAYNIPVPGQQYSVTASKKLKGYDKFILASGGQGIAMSNFGINYAGVYLEK